jgi:2-hydroxychromene-2-carboxylate isomerase
MRYVSSGLHDTPVFSNRVTQSKGTEAETILSGNTQNAIDSGAFGLPWFDCIDAYGARESFWGIDHLGRLVDFLQLDATLDKSFRVLL